MMGARSVWSGPCGAQTASALPTYDRLTESGQGQQAGVGRGSQWRCIDRLGCPTFRRFQSLLVSSFYCFEFSLKNKTTQLSTVDRFESSPVKPVANRLLHRRIHAKVKRTGSFPDKVGDYAPVVSLQGVIPRRYALQFFLPSTVQITARSIPPHGLERSAQLSSLC